MTTSTVNPSIIEQGNPAQDLRAFRKCLGQFATGVTVITTACEGELAGMSVNSFAALSLEPPLVLWSIRRESSSLDIFRRSGHYAVNILAEDQIDISNRFAKPGEAKFETTPWQKGRLGAPLLAGVIGSLECHLEQVIEAGDHFIMVGRVEHYVVYGGKPLLFVQGRYAMAEEPSSSSAESGATSSGAEPSASVGEVNLLRRFHYVSHLMSSGFDRKRQELGLSVAEFRVYGWLRKQNMSEAELAQCLYLGANEMRDALDSLRARGHIEETPERQLSLTPAGREVSLASVEHVQHFEQQLLQGVAPADLAALQRVTDHLMKQAKALNAG